MPYKRIRSNKEKDIIDKANELEKEGWSLVAYTLTIGGVSVGIFHKVGNKEVNQE